MERIYTLTSIPFPFLDIAIIFLHRRYLKNIFILETWKQKSCVRKIFVIYFYIDSKEYTNNRLER